MDKADAQRIAEAYKTPRYREIETLESYITGAIYDGRPDFFTGTSKPLLERRPCCRYPIAKIAIRSHADMVLGEGKWPRAAVRKPKSGEAGLSDEQRKALDALYAAIVEAAELRSRMREGLELAMCARSVAFVACVRRGKPSVQLFGGKCCALERDADGCPVKLTIEYPYLEEYKDPVSGKWTWRCMLYRREIDEQKDNVYVPVQADVVADGKYGLARPSVIDRKKSRAHGLGFCPVAWYAFMPPAGHEDALDGRALHEDQLSDTVVLDIGISQRARAAHQAGDPQKWEAGVNPDDVIAPTGRGVSQPILDDKGRAYAALGATAAPAATRQTGAGVVWSSPNKDYRAGMLTLPGDALKALDEHIQDLARRIGLGMAYVDLEPQKAHSGEKSSGRALEILLKPQVEFDGRIREDFGQHGICAVLSLLLRVACATEKKSPGGVYLDGLSDLAETLSGFERPIGADGEPGEGPSEEGSTETDDGAQVATVWMPPPIDLKWGPFFADTSADTIKDRVDAANGAVGKLISRRSATSSVAHAFGIEDVDAEIEQMDAEAANDDQDVADADASAGDQQVDEGGGDSDPNATPSDGAPPQSAPASPTGKVVPIMPKARAAAAKAPAVKDPGGTGSALLAKKFAETGAPADGPPGMQHAQAHTPTLDPGAHLRASGAQTPAFNPGTAATVRSLLAPDYPKKAIDWIDDPDLVESIEGPRLVPLEQIDFTNQDNWSANDEDISGYVDKIAEGKLKPIVLVNEPNDNKLMIVDGHHRGLGYKKLGKPAMAYIVHLKTVGDPRVAAMHSHQSNGNGKLTSQQKGA